MIPGEQVDAAALLPSTRTYWRYDGSLTTPPCTQDVNWAVMAEPVEVSAAQIAAFTAAYQDNERPLQALNSRTFISTPATLPATGEAAVSGSEGLTAAGLLMMATGLALVLTLRRRGLS